MTMSSRQEILEREMSPLNNPFIAGGRAAKEAERHSLGSDTTTEGINRRLASPLFNKLIPGSPISNTDDDAELRRLFHEDRAEFWRRRNEALDRGKTSV